MPARTGDRKSLHTTTPKQQTPESYNIISGIPSRSHVPCLQLPTFFVPYIQCNEMLIVGSMLTKHTTKTDT